MSTKRGAHLALSLERLEHVTGKGVQRIGLSATQRNMDEVGRYLGGVRTGADGCERCGQVRPVRQVRAGARAPDAEHTIHDEFAAPLGSVEYRPVTLIDAREPKRLSITVEVPIADMAKVGTPVEQPSGPAAQGPQVQTIWSSIHPRLLELVLAHRSTLLFVNSRRLAERLAGALNDLAGEALVRAHHGSLARAQRSEIEDLLKAGRLRGLVATSSLELGIDMGAIDLVVPDRGATLGRERAATYRPIRSQPRRGQRRRHLPEVPR